MAKVSVSAAAQRDLEDILVFSISTFGSDVATDYRDELDSAIARIGRDPRIGRPIRLKTRTFLKYNCRSHGIFYVVDATGVTVVRVLHLAMDFTRHLIRS